MLIDVLPPEARKVVYAVYAAAVFILGAVQVGFTAGGQDQPAWLTVALAVAAFVGTAIGAVAASNITAGRSAAEVAADEALAAEMIARLNRKADQPHVRWTEPEGTPEA